MAGNRKHLILLTGFIVGILLVVTVGSIIMDRVKGPGGKEIENVQDVVPVSDNVKKTADEVDAKDSEPQMAVDEHASKDKFVSTHVSVAEQGEGKNEGDITTSTPSAKISNDSARDVTAIAASTNTDNAGEMISKPGEKFFFWSPFEFHYKAEKFAAQVKKGSGVDCLVKEEKGKYAVYFLYDDEDDLLQKISLIEEATKLKISNHGSGYE